MKIAIDSWTLASRFRHHGTYVYAMNLISEFKRLSGNGHGVEFCVFASDTAANDAKNIKASSGLDLARTRLLNNDRLWRLGGAGLAAARSGANVVFCPTTSILPLAAVPVVSTIHDLTAVTMPSHSPRVTRLLRWLLWWTAKLSRAIITDSECSRRDLIARYGLPEERVSVIYLGYDRSLFNAEPANRDKLRLLRERLGIGPRYIVHHGTIQPRKNLQRLIAAYRLLLSQKSKLDLDLVLVGELGWEYQEILDAAAQPGEGKVVLPGPLEDADLALLVKGAELAVIPSLYEGFCLPMVESMACGTPTIAANSSCLPEISANTLLYFNPQSIGDMAQCMEKVLSNETVRKGLSERGWLRAAEFSWKSCAQETLQVLLKAAES